MTPDIYHEKNQCNTFFFFRLVEKTPQLHLHLVLFKILSGFCVRVWVGDNEKEREREKNIFIQANHLGKEKVMVFYD